jgi:hypothetical protein
MAAWWGWVAEMADRVAGCAHPLKTSAPGFEVQAYIACVVEVTFEGSVLLRPQNDRRNGLRNAQETVLL